MAATVTGPQAPVRPATDRRRRRVLALGVVQLLLAAPMLVPIVALTLTAARYLLALGVVGVVFAPVVAAGPLLGLEIGGLVARLREFRRDTGFAVRTFGLLLGTVIEYLALRWN